MIGDRLMEAGSDAVRRRTRHALAIVMQRRRSYPPTDDRRRLTVSAATTRPPLGSLCTPADIVPAGVRGQNVVSESRKPAWFLLPGLDSNQKATPRTYSDADGHRRSNEDVTRSGAAIAPHETGHARTYADTAGKA